MADKNPVVNFYRAEKTAPAPVAGDAQVQISDLRSQLEAAAQQLEEQRKEVERLSAGGEKAASLTKERDALQAQLAKVEAEYADYRQASDKTGKQLQEQRDTASAEAAAFQAQVDSLTTERDQLKARVDALEASGKTVSPLADRDAAIAKISSVNRVSDAMAAEIYDALTKPEGQ